MVITNQLKNQHLLWRATFGPAPTDFNSLQNSNPSSLLKNLLNASSKTPAYIDVASDVVKEAFTMDMNMQGAARRQPLDENKRRMIRQQSQQDIRNLNITWLKQMIGSEQQLREKMSLFWHGHFACRIQQIVYQQQLLDVVRRNALGNFGDMLREVSKSAAMLNFLNNNQNRKDHPNENFAREVMELFTMGRGNYTEDDIKEAARAFTGWGASINGEFLFRRQQHDTGKKTVLGKSGNFDGDDVLNILLENKQTANYITRKIYRYFVNDIPDEAHISQLADRFYQSNYDIKELMAAIFSANWFYDAKNIGCRIKSPVELIAGIRRALPMTVTNEDAQLLLQRLLGQILFYPPNVAGWPGGKNWIDSSSLMLRMRIPQMFFATEELNMKPKDDDDQMMGMKDGGAGGAGKPARKAGGQNIMAAIDWNGYLQNYEKVSREQLVTTIAGSLLQTDAGMNAAALGKFTDSSSKESFIKTTTIQLMSTPEYQLC
ncbi:MAG: DUF1800 domain-containing protein [Chitinophagaceae bacterium]